MISINNPGNIRLSSTTYIGEVVPSHHKSFKTFENMFWGFRAVFRLLNTYISQYNVNTIEKMIYRYAPPNDNNDTEAYIKFVCEKTSFQRNKQFIKSDADLIPLVYAMSWLENGIKPNYRQVEIGYKLINIQTVEEGIKVINDVMND